MTISTLDKPGNRSAIKRLSVKQTRALSRFQKVFGNRDVKNPKIKRLAKSIRDNGMLVQPVLINEKWQVVDGQHRLEAAVLCNTFVYYIMVHGYGLKEAQILNQEQSNWSMLDRVKSYAISDMEEYNKLYNFYLNNKDFKLNTCSMILSGLKSSPSQKIREGTFKAGNILQAQKRASDIRRIGKYFKGYYGGRFVRAMMRLFNEKSDVFDIEEFLNKLRLQPTLLEERSKADQYIDLIEQIYNYRRRDKVNLRY